MMKTYIISGLGADKKVFDRIDFSGNIEPVFIDWLIPIPDESFEEYVQRMASSIDASEPFNLIGYSFGGIIVQEINKRLPAEKVVILGSIKSDREKSKLMKLAPVSSLIKKVPESVFTEKSAAFYAFFRTVFDPKNPKLMQYFCVKDPYYLKWSIEKILEWKFEEDPKVIQILADKDIVFPLKNSKPDYVIKDATHLFPVTKPKEVSEILKEVLH